ncbi:hypothetical protein GCM10009839_54420 [Catenulispora yoronensis]|uniref:Carrier domain-containing protein n=1 Tax=Catenulispora yoronensis TaxID=450799 RepID=A0ABN2UWT5_9ACTN
MTAPGSGPETGSESGPECGAGSGSECGPGSGSEYGPGSGSECGPGAFVGLLALFRRQVERNGLATAVVDERSAVTYQDLDRRSELVARSLAARGLGPGGLVAVRMPNSADLLVALFGVLKSGAGYVPLAADDPEERTAAIVASSKAGLVIADRAGLVQAGAAPETVLLADLEAAGEALVGAVDRPVGPAPDDTAYVIHTSGSTGAPKGVVIDHAALAVYLRVALTEYPALAGRTLVHSSISFDMSVTSLFGPLIAGGTIETGNLMAIAADGVPAHLGKPSFLKVTPSHLPLLEALPEVVSPSEQLVIGGEALYREALNRWWAGHPGVEVINEYGPTEATVGCCIHRVEPAGPGGPDGAVHGPVPIGVPTAGTRLHVLDGEGREVPDGDVGELYIGGAQVARGYLHDAHLSELRFRPDPFGAEGATWYRTGDLVRRDASGILEYLGREDDQVKIDGHRVELGEVEAALLRCAGISQAAVLATAAATGSKRLSAFVRPVPGAELDAAAIRAELEAAVPAFLVPSRITVVGDFVLTANGKVDRAWLAAIEDASGAAGPGDGEADPADLLCRLVAEVTGAHRVGPDDDFLNLGGGSVGAAQLVGLARAAGIGIGIRDVLRHRTVRGMLRHARPASRPVREEVR